ncbi:TPA: hypothetical protein ACHWHD_003454 [Providencia stuartii]|nr:Uncharacterised protein [Acinetobacter baumannii]
MNKIPSDYFLSVDDDLLAFLEKQGEDCIKEIYQSNAVNRENGYKLLNILIVGIGSSFLLLTQKHTWDYMTTGLTAFTLLWVLSAIYLVIYGLAIQTRGLPSAPPDRLYTAPYKTINNSHYDEFAKSGFYGNRTPLPIIRRYRLVDLCLTANELEDANAKVRLHLKRARIATILTPVISIIIAAITYLFF